jgi:hypothetical protein
MNDIATPILNAQLALDAVADDELTEAADLCALVGIPAEYTRNLAAAIAVCGPDGVL